MIIELPFKYKVRGLYPRHRNPSESNGIDAVNVNIRDVSEHDCPVVLALLDENGIHAETFRFFENEFWIRNSREDDLDFGRQHLMLMGQWPSKAQTTAGYHDNARNFKPFTAADAKANDERMMKGLSLVGIIRYCTVEEYGLQNLVSKELQPKDPYFQQADGSIGCRLKDPGPEFRAIESTDIEDQRMRAVTRAQSNLIAVDGDLWHKVPKPMILATDKQITWGFDGTIKGELRAGYGYGHEKEDSSLKDAYRMELTEFDTISEAYPDAIETGKVKFYIEYIDPAAFERPDFRPLVIKDIKTCLRESGVLDRATSYVYKWLELRDLLKSVDKKIPEDDDDFLDEAADIIVTLDAMTEQSRYPGAFMWSNRKVELDAALSAKPGGLKP